MNKTTLNAYTRRLEQAEARLIAITGKVDGNYFLVLKQEADGAWRETSASLTAAANAMADGTAIRASATNANRSVAVYVDPIQRKKSVKPVDSTVPDYAAGERISTTDGLEHTFIRVSFRNRCVLRNNTDGKERTYAYADTKRIPW